MHPNGLPLSGLMEKLRFSIFLTVMEHKGFELWTSVLKARRPVDHERECFWTQHRQWNDPGLRGYCGHGMLDYPVGQPMWVQGQVERGPSITKFRGTTTASGRSTYITHWFMNI